MIPGLLAQDVAKSLREFIVTGFETDTWPFTGKFEQLVNGDENSLHEKGEAFIKGPYLSLSLPFAKNTDSRDFFSGFKTEHSPFAHQQQAWSNLRSSGNPQSTIVATGTGSGKTECFLYPLLEHCLQNPEPGIKAIVIYPMNALAGDQAKRFAEVIHNTPQLAGKIRVGLFIGGHSDDRSMSENQVITCKETLKKTPPDILLTNYKMLDFLLMRPSDQGLWQHNGQDTLRYLVVDELHTFDGAQGSDLAMLIRRLKARLGVNTENLICVGTSATLGNEPQNDALIEYASKIFATEFSRNSIIGESRESHDQFLDQVEHMMLDSAFSIADLDPDRHDSLNDYLKAQARLFFGDAWTLVPDDMESRQELGDKLRKHLFLHYLLDACSQTPVSVKELLGEIRRFTPAQLEPGKDENVAAVLLSFLSLLSHARGKRYPGEPYVTVRLQLWVRELRRIVARVGTDTKRNPVYLQFADDLRSRAENENQADIYLPTVQCNECHTTAWLTAIKQGETHVQRELRDIYTRFFSRDKQVQVLLPLQTPDCKPPTRGSVKYLCSNCGHLQTAGGKCSSCDKENLVTVFAPDLNKEVRRSGIIKIESQRMCPVCQAKDSLLVFGSRAASLSSEAIHQMFANRINDDKKLIAFSDSVQDAAHRAGFFSARTWKNNVRMALAKSITHYCETNNSDIPLEKLYNYVPHFWLEEVDNDDRLDKLNYITQFISPNLQTESDYLILKKTGELTKPDPLVDLIGKRFIWEILSEFGYRSLIGRSLERTGVASISWNPSLIENAAKKLLNSAKEQLGLSLSQKHASYLLWGIALRMKRQGAIYNQILKGYIEDGGDYYSLRRKIFPFMPAIGKQSALPRFPGETKENRLDILFSRNQGTWYSRWVRQFVPADQLVDNNFVSELLKLVMQSLVSCGLAQERNTNGGTRVWALNPAELYLTTDLGAVHLRRSSSVSIDDGESNKEILDAYGSWYLPEAWVEHIAGMPSLDQPMLAIQASACYEHNERPNTSMFKDFYVSGEIRRVIGHEHTALLERSDREAIEQRFTATTDNRQDWYENLLSATPTLEMGIDIGDLSSVLLCSVPPNQAKYQQRAGRGGRKDGNSFIMTLANGRPHDLYFYSDPLKMLAGGVQTPAIFLNATMVLKRQLLAFCFDNWGMSFNGENVIPPRMQAVLDAVENEDETRFPYTLLDFISKNRNELWEKFSGLISKEASKETLAALKSYLLSKSMDSNELRFYILSRIKQVVDERKNLAQHQRALANRLRSIRNEPQDEARDLLEKEVSTELEGIKKLKTDLNKKETLNFLTDEGLLPNYAFPEEGTILKSVIFNRLSSPEERADGRTVNYEKKEVFEYVRPAHAGISELAPENTFYAGNRKVEIQRIEMAGGSNLEQWRLCPNCSYSEQLPGADNHTACPRCDASLWADAAQVMPMVRLRQVYANTQEDRAFIGDDSDTREPIFYNRQMLIDFDPADILHAYAMKTDSKPFGFEFIKKAQFQEINFGRLGSSDQVLKVAGIELARPGFKICKECGAVQPEHGRINHLFTCGYKKTPSEQEEDYNHESGIIKCLYLYREYESEAVRILMPRLSFTEREAQIQSFVAAIQLGLKKQFGGEVNHINITTSDEPIPESGERAYFLVLYDTVPGGTGYLHDLLNEPKNLITMLESARQVMQQCSCQYDPATDGCYNCLYAYKNSYDMEYTSRTMALHLLDEILDGNTELVPIEQLQKIDKSVWADSELERRFPEALQALNNNPQLENIRVKVTKDIINGKIGFKLEIGDLIYSVEPHVKLGEEHGALYQCEPDFLVSSDRESKQGVKVAIFLDGYKYHKDIVHEDLLKRQGISLGTEMLTWSLTWYDVTEKFAANEVKVPNPFREHTDKAPINAIGEIGVARDLNEHQTITELSPLPMLIRFLSDPDMEKWISYSMLRALSWLDQSQMQQSQAKAIFDNLSQPFPSQYQDACDTFDPRFFTVNQYDTEDYRLSVLIAGGEKAVTDLDPLSLSLSVIFSPLDIDAENTREAWQRLLQILNLGQFLPLFFAGTETGITNADFSELQWLRESTSIESGEWDDLANLVDDEISEFFVQLAALDPPLPKIGYELADDRNAGIGEAELAWEECKVALMLNHQYKECHQAFEERGWFVVRPTDGVEFLASKLKG